LLSTSSHAATGWAVGDSTAVGVEPGVILYTTDAGETWKQQTTGVPNVDLRGASFSIPAADGGNGGGGGGGGGGVCFIATASYGTPMAEEVKALSRFRDEYLLTNPVGSALVRFYYRHSSRIADFIRDKKSLKAMSR
jgi:hypothetical protein